MTKVWERITSQLQICLLKDTYLQQISIIFKKSFHKTYYLMFLCNYEQRVSSRNNPLLTTYFRILILINSMLLMRWTLLNDLCKRSCFRLAYHFTSHNLYHKGWEKMKELAQMDKCMPKMSDGQVFFLINFIIFVGDTRYIF